MKPMTEKHRKIAVIVAFSIFLLLFVLLAVFLSKPILSFFEDPNLFREYVEEKGFLAKLVFVGIVMLQVLVALIPGEPLEIAAGIAFGSFTGTVLFMVGVALGSALVFLLVRSLGVKMVEVFFPVEKIHSLKFLHNARRFHTVLFVVMCIPGTPKDLLSYFVGLTEMKLKDWMILSTVARIPSVVTSTVGGNFLAEGKYLFAILLFGVTALFSLLGLFWYETYKKKKGKEKDQSCTEQNCK